jgi:hypothetical protein
MASSGAESTPSSDAKSSAPQPQLLFVLRTRAYLCCAGGTIGLLPQQHLAPVLELVVSWNRLQKLMVVLNRLATVIDEVNVHALHRYSTDKGVDVQHDVLRQARLRP